MLYNYILPATSSDLEPSLPIGQVVIVAMFKPRRLFWDIIIKNAKIVAQRINFYEAKKKVNRQQQF